MTHGAHRNRRIAQCMIAALAMLAITSSVCRAQVLDVPSLPAMAEMHEYELSHIVRTDTLVYAEWTGEAEVIRALYLDEWEEPVYWAGSEWFGMPGVWDPLPIPDAPLRLQDRALWAAYWQTVWILNEVKEALR